MLSIVDWTPTSSLRQVLRLVPGAFVCVGRLCTQKGQLLLIDAAHLLATEGTDFELVLAGDGELRADIEVLIAAYKLQGRVRITGWISAERVREEILSGAGAGAAELCRRPACRPDGGHGASAASDQHLCCRHSGAGPSGESMAGWCRQATSGR